MNNLTFNKKKKGKKMPLASKSHLNYYKFVYGSENLEEILKQMNIQPKYKGDTSSQSSDSQESGQKSGQTGTDAQSHPEADASKVSKHHHTSEDTKLTTEHTNDRPEGSKPHPKTEPPNNATRKTSASASDSTKELITKTVVDNKPRSTTSTTNKNTKEKNTKGKNTKEINTKEKNTKEKNTKEQSKLKVPTNKGKSPTVTKKSSTTSDNEINNKKKVDNQSYPEKTPAQKDSVQGKSKPNVTQFIQTETIQAGPSKAIVTQPQFDPEKHTITAQVHEPNVAEDDLGKKSIFTRGPSTKQEIITKQPLPQHRQSSSHRPSGHSAPRVTFEEPENCRNKYCAASRSQSSQIRDSKYLNELGHSTLVCSGLIQHQIEHADIPYFYNFELLPPREFDQTPPSPAPEDYSEEKRTFNITTNPLADYLEYQEQAQYLEYSERLETCTSPLPPDIPRLRVDSPTGENYSGYCSDGQRPTTSKAADSLEMGKMNTLEDHERKIIIEFCHLLEKSKQLFNGLRELPQYGHKQWHSYFGRTFDVYTKLWKFQQQHRHVLDNKYGLKRWQIGEVASKIGQLYYHFYLRTSETAYLNEAFSFYSAIRGRCYYTKASKEDRCELMVKKLRYYARFIVVCLLLKKLKLVRELIKELDRQIIEYGNTYDPDDQIEWTVVVDEVRAFVQAEPVVSVIHPDSYPVVLSNRLTPASTPPVERSAQMTLSLQEILIIGSSSQQVKFSELTIDMYRMLQTLEREPASEAHHIYDDSPRQRVMPTPNAPTNKGYIESHSRQENPHKYLLFKPSPSQVLVYLASGCNDLPPNGALLLYISADGQIVQPSKHPEDVGYENGGLITTSRNDVYKDKDQKAPPPSKYKELQCLYPGDLFPYTRRPLFIIIDSDNSYSFQNIPRHFGQPLVILMSPIELPPSFQDRKQQGNLLTLFLHSPLAAFLYCCDIHTISLVQWERAQAYVDTFMAEASQIFVRNRIDTTFIAFMGDDFLRLLIMRFIFCEVTLRLHRSFRARTHRTRSSPPLPDDLLEHHALVHIVMDLIAHLQVRSHFHDPSAAGPPPKE